MASKPSRFVVEPRLLDHFGIAMYNTVEKAIGELVANAYDADATRVRITYEDDLIAVKDNGTGMTRKEVDESYLRLGRNRRAEGETTSRGRPVIGNKGIGKLQASGSLSAWLSRPRAVDAVRVSPCGEASSTVPSLSRTSSSSRRSQQLALGRVVPKYA